jgi:amidase
VTASLADLHDTAVFDATGHPALSVPCGFSDGLPIGMMFVGRHLEDAMVLRAAHAYETARGELGSRNGKAALARA